MTTKEAVAYTFQRRLMAASFNDPEVVQWADIWREAVRIRLKYGDDADWELCLEQERRTP